MGFDYAAYNAVVPGNVDLGHRPHVENIDGSISTVDTMSFADDGVEVLVPRVADAGYVLSEDDAIREYRRTGRHLGKYRTIDDANAAAEAINAALDADPPIDTLLADKAAGTHLGAKGLFRRELVVQVDTLRIDGLAASFDIVKSLSHKTPNSAEVRVYNLNADHRKQLQQLERVYVSIEAGYRGNRSLIFRGDLRGVLSTRDRAEWVTTITSDTARTARKRRIAKSFAPGASVGEVLRSLAASLGVNLGNTALAAATSRIAATRSTQFFNGYSAAGAIGDELDRLTRSTGLEWSVQDGELQFLDRGRALQDTLVLLTPRTGLIGAAERGNTGLTDVKCLMIPDLFPGRRVKLESAYLSGVYRIESTKHRGGIHEREWYVEMQLKAEERASTP